MDEQSVQVLQRWIDASCRIVFFGGAGVSTDSGIPDFRSQNGLYHMQYKYPPEQILSHTFLLAHPDEFWRFCRDKLIGKSYSPNVVHTTLAQWERQGKLLAVITQNIDDLHEKAGTKQLYKLHGSTARNYCMRCGKFYALADLPSGPTPRCVCGGVIRPDVVLYEEALDDEVVEGAVRALEQADLLIVAGTSLAVYPAAGLLQYYGGRRMVLINRDPTPYDGAAQLVLHENLSEVFGALH